VSNTRYTGFWARFIAFLLDSTVAGLLISPLVVMVAGSIDITQYNLSDPIDARELLSKLSLQLGLDMGLLGIVFITFWILKSATPGKMILKCCIVDEKTLGKASNRQNIIRYAGYFLSLIPLGLGFLWIAFDKRKQGCHDKLSGTLVIYGQPLDSTDHETESD